MQAQNSFIAMAKLQQNAPIGAKLTNIFAQKLVLGVFGVVMFCFFFFWFPFPSLVGLTFLGFSVLLFIFAFFPIPYRLSSVRHRIEYWGISGKSKTIAFVPSASHLNCYDVVIMTQRKEKKVRRVDNRLLKIEGTSTYKAAVVQHDVYTSTGAFDCDTVWSDLPAARCYLLFFLLVSVNSKDSIFDRSSLQMYCIRIACTSIFWFFPVFPLIVVVRLYSEYFHMLRGMNIPNPSPTLPEEAETTEKANYTPITYKKP